MRVLKISETSLFHQRSTAWMPTNAHWLSPFLILSFIFRAIAITFCSHLFSIYKWYFIHSKFHFKQTIAASKVRLFFRSNLQSTLPFQFIVMQCRLVNNKHNLKSFTSMVLFIISLVNNILIWLTCRYVLLVHVVLDACLIDHRLLQEMIWRVHIKQTSCSIQLINYFTSHQNQILTLN